MMPTLEWANKITGANAGEPRQLPVPALWAARIAQGRQFSAGGSMTPFVPILITLLVTGPIIMLVRYRMYIVIGIIAFLFVLQAVAARLEKRMIWPYGSPEAQPQFPDSTGYSARWIDDALKVGFSFLGWSPDLKGPRYRVCYAFLVSQERDCFVIVGVGTILSMTLRGTWIYTRATDGRVFYTTDNQACVEIDVARQWRSQLVRTGAFTELLQGHRDLLHDSGVTPQPFTAGREAQEFKSCREERYQSMSRNGLIAFTDGSATYWRYTFWGALKLAALNYSIGLLRGVTHGRIPRTA